MTRTVRRDRARSGFTLIEVLVATILVGVAVVSTSWAMTNAARAKVQEELEDPITAELVAQEVYELAKSLPSEPSGTHGVTDPADVVALDSLVGARFSPPILADGTADSTKSGWGQIVNLTVYGIGDLDSATLDSALSGLEKSDPKLFQLSVTVTKDGVEVDTWRWFLTP